MLTCDDHLTPGSLDEAFDMMASNRGRYRIIAGATDALPWAREGRAGDVHTPALIDVAKIPELCECARGGGLGAWGDWNVGNWCEDVQTAWIKQDL